MKGKAGKTRPASPCKTEAERGEIVKLKQSEAVHRQTITALRKSEAYFRAITQNSSDIVIVVNKKGTITYVNPSIERLLGYSPEELIGKSGFDYIVLADIPRAVYDFGRAILTERLDIRNHFRIRHKNGSERVLEGVGRNLLDDPVVAGFVMNVRDITERKQAEEELSMHRKCLEDLVRERTSELTSINSRLLVELAERRKAEEALRESEAKYRSVLDNMQDIFCRIDLDGNITMINAGFLKTLGYESQEDILGKNIEEFLHDSSGSYGKVIKEIRRKGSLRNYEVAIQRRDGTRLITSVNSHLHYDKWGSVSGIEGILRDITDLKQAEEEKSNLEKQLLHSQKMEAMGVLASGVAHDFNNVLMSIMGYAELMKAKTTDQQNHSYLDQLLCASGRAKDLVNQILTFSRRKEGEKKPVIITPIVKEVMRFLRSSLPGTINIQHSYADMTDTVIADSTQIHQIIMNLCTNAVHAMRDQGGTLEVTLDHEEIAARRTDCHPELKEGAYLRIRVRDTGYGIDPSIQDRIFDPFFTTKKSGEGTGLGLSVVYGIVRNHNGAVHVSSETGKGALFTVYLPLVVTDQVTEPAEMESAPGGKERILLVDDEESILSVEREILSSLGYDVSCRRSSLDALDAFRAGPDRFDLVITDITMPNMTGVNLAREMLKIRPETRIILATGYSGIFSEKEAKEMGMKDFMKKPVSLNSLARTVRDVLDYQ